MGSSGEWLEKALLELRGKPASGVELDSDLISGLVSFCELAPPLDAADYLKNIIGPGAVQQIVQEYLQRRGHVDSFASSQDAQASNFQDSMKPKVENSVIATKKQIRTPKEASVPSAKALKSQAVNAESSNNPKGNHKKKKAGKSISLADAAKGSVVFRQGQPCSCQARRHKLVSNCLSCGKIVCEQEGEGPCSFCGALVLREGSTYAGLNDDDLGGPLTDAEAAAEAYAKRLVDYDRNSAARTTVIDDQSDYYEFESNSWLSEEEKTLLRKKQEEIEEAEKARKEKVIVTFDLLGRKVILNRDDAAELESGSRILRPLEEREQNRIKPNPTIKIQPVFVLPPARDQATRGKPPPKRPTNGMCLEVSGKVQHDDRRFTTTSSQDGLWQDPQTTSYGDEPECSLDYN